MFPWGGKETCWDGLTWSLAKIIRLDLPLFCFYLSLKCPAASLTDHSTSALAKPAFKAAIKTHIRKVFRNWEFPNAVQSFWILKPSRVLWESLQCAGLPTFHSKYMNESCVRNIQYDCANRRGERHGNSRAPRDERTRGTDTKELHSLLIPFMNTLKGKE